ncbi:MAG: hypothetical protein AW09_000757 [Candidatus Accumulibacter phosphatis]|uniref:Uncharacterized protein n=1 Tax=Candidatus Accumulibacter phosphatis TaxID=327160 RepID=A0A080LYJ1_9PROT|nr:MAG: hypothetical protein AW09_000757 [Candidatus Accumulibacter phosphatis]
MFPCQLADPVGRDRRAVGIGFVVESGQGVDQIEVVAGDHFAVMVGSITVGNRLSKRGFVKRRVIKGDRTGIDRLGREPGHQRDDCTRVDTTGKEGAERHFRDHAQANRLAEFLVELCAGIRYRTLVVETETQIPVFFGLCNRQAAA